LSNCCHCRCLFLSRLFLAGAKQGLVFISALENVQNTDIRAEDPEVILLYVDLDIRRGPTG
jgi:hypothetical protein